MESSERIVFNYRSWKPFFKALGWVVFGPLAALILVYGLLKPPYPTSILDKGTYVGFWGMVVYVCCEVVVRLIFLFNFVNERIVLEGSHLTYYNGIGRKRISLDLSSVEEIDTLSGPAWKVFTPQGRFVFNDQLRNYQDLLNRFRDAGTAINSLPHL
jgi:hypothetical protein